MFKFIISILISMFAVNIMSAAIINYDDSHIIYCDEETHLQYMLNISTKEASIGNGIDSEHNALYYPPFGDDWWTDQQPNLWGDVIVPSTIEYEGETYTVTEVAENAFCRTTAVSSVKLPETIKVIGSSAFKMCTELTSINVPEGVTIIGNQAFYSCRSLKGLLLPSTIEEIGGAVFTSCVLLESMNIPGKCRSVGSDSFSWCIALNSLTIEDGDTPLKLGYAYDFGPMWEPYKEPYYYPRMFARGMFNDCPIKSLYIGRNLEYDDKAGTITSPFEHNTVKIGANDNPVYICSGKNFNSVRFGNEVTEIHACLFKDAHIPDLQLPENLVCINDEAFYKAFDNLQIVIPEKCDSIGKNALYGSFKSIACKSNVPPRINTYSFCSNYDKENTIVDVPSGMRSVYENDPLWKEFYICDPEDELVDINVKYANSLYGRLALLDKEPGDVRRLKLSGVLGNDDLEVLNSMKLYELDLSEVTLENITTIKDALKFARTLKFPKGMNEIPSGIFGWSQLQGEIIIPEDCKVIKAYAFGGSPINKLIISGPTIVEEYAFRFCKYLNEISISGGATLNNSSFEGIYDVNNHNIGLETLTLGNGVNVGMWAFGHCKHLTNIIIDGNVANIGANAFTGCTNIKSMTFNGSITQIEENAFGNNGDSDTPLLLDELRINDINGWCYSSFSANTNPISFSKKTYLNGAEICNVDIPDDVHKIGNYAFYGCEGLRKVSILGDDVEIGESCFKGCSNLAEIKMSETTKSIGSSAFEGCVSLETIALPKEMDKIPSSLFASCEALKSIEIPTGVTSIEHDAFSGCKSLEKISIPLNCLSIENNAFKQCSSLTDLLLPQHISTIGDNAFEGCELLTKIKALWTTAPTINTNAFNDVNKKCILYVPVGSVPSYYENGWGRIPLIDEGFCVIKINNNLYGKIKYLNKEYVGNDDVLMVDIDSDVVIEVKPYENYTITGLNLDDTPIPFDVHSSTISLNNVSDNHNIYVDYGKYLLGDVNEDSTISITDVIGIVSHVLNKTPEIFNASAADVNEDGEITITDAVSLMNNILNKK